MVRMQPNFPAIAAPMTGKWLAATSDTGDARREGKIEPDLLPLGDANQNLAGFLQSVGVHQERRDWPEVR